MAVHDVIWHGITLWSVQVRCPRCVPSQTLTSTQPTHCVGRERKQKNNKRNLDVVQALLSNSHLILVKQTSESLVHVGPVFVGYSYSYFKPYKPLGF